MYQPKNSYSYRGGPIAGTPSKAKRRSNRDPFTPNTLMLIACMLLGIFTMAYVGLSMHPDVQNYKGRKELPGDHSSSGSAPKYTVKRNVNLISNGFRMPAVGFGTAGLGEHTAELVEMALRDVGYQRLDTAQAREWYREDLVGLGLKNSKVERESVFITTKVHPRDFGLVATRAAIDRSLKDLGTSYLDLVLLHYAECWGDLCGGVKPEGTWRDAWAALEALVEKRIVRCVGVSNFGVEQLEELLKVAKVKPCLVQNNFEPFSASNRDVLDFCKANNIQFESYSTLGGQYYGRKGGNPVLIDPLINRIAAEKRKAPAQIVLRWALQNRATVVPKTTKLEHMKENINLWDFELSDREMEEIDSLGLTSLN